MAKYTFPRSKSLVRCVGLWLAFVLAAAGLFASPGVVQAATLTIDYSGDALPATVGTAWSRTFSASGGNGTYACSMGGSVPGLSFNTSTCTLAGTPSAMGAYGVTINFTDSADPQNTGSTSFTFEAYQNTAVTLALSSSHPTSGTYMVGYPVWVTASVAYTPGISGQTPDGSVAVTSGSGGPGCTITLVSGTGECALVFGTSGSKTITASYTGSGYVRSSTDSETVNVLAYVGTPMLSAARNHTCYLAADGMMSCWGLEDGIPLDGSGNPLAQGYFAKISSGGYHTCGIRLDGSIACWGENTDVTLNIPAGQFTDLSSGEEHVCAINSQRTLTCWGNMSAALRNNVPTVKVKAVSAGINHDCAIRYNNNRPVCWGSNFGTVPNQEVGSLAVGSTHTCAIRTTGALTCWGSLTSAPSGTNFTAIGSGSDYSCAQSDGKLDCFGTGNPGVNEASAYARFSSAFLHICALTTGGTPTLACWGDNTYGKAPRISLSPASMEEYLVLGRTYSQTFTADGGHAPYTINLAGGSLPAGLALSSGTISGTLSTTGSYTFSLSAAETFAGSTLPLQLAPGVQAYATTVLNGTTTTSLALPGTADAGSPVTATVTVGRVATAPTLTGNVLVYSTDGDTSCQAAVQADLTASCTLYFSTTGVKAVKAEYQGDVYYNSSLSSEQSITIYPILITPKVGAGNQFTCSIDGSGHLSCWGKGDSFQNVPPPSGLYDQLDLGYSHACALKLNRTVGCWGWNGYNISTPPADLSGVRKVTTGRTHTCALTNAGTVTCWGQNTENRLTVPAAGTGNTYTDLDAGENHTCAILSTGGVNCWGVNTSGQVNVPSDLLTRGSVQKISAGNNFTCAVHLGGAMECWGGLAAAPGSYSNVSAGQNFACGLKTDGSLNCWGSLNSAPAGTFLQVTAGYDHACALVSDERMLCWGDNSQGQAPLISITPDSLPTLDADAAWNATVSAAGGRTTEYTYNVISGALPTGLVLDSNSGTLGGTPMQAGVYSFTLRARESGPVLAIMAERAYTQTVRGWVSAAIDGAAPMNAMAGSPMVVNFSVSALDGNDMGQPPSGTVTVSAEGNTCQVTLVNGAGSCSMLFAQPGLKTISISYPGDALYQPDEDGTFEYTVLPFSQAAQLRSGLDHTYIYNTDGTVGCIGSNCSQQPFAGIWTHLGVGDAYACGLQTDGSIVCASYGGAPQLAFSHGPYVDLSVGASHACAIKINGQAECQGDNTYGQLAIPGGSYALLSAGGQFTCALTASGNAVCWGNITGTPAGNFGQLAAGTAHVCALDASGAATCWGDNSVGQTSVPTVPAAFSRITAGGAHTCGLDAAGAVTCWGDDALGQAGPVYGTFIDIAAYDDHTCALRSGLKLTCWGEDDWGEAPHYSFTSLAVTHLPALTYFEHIFDIYGGTKPLTAEAQGTLPPGLDVAIPGGLTGEASINDLSPSGMILYGTPRTPGIYPFVIQWTDASTYPLVMQQPYTLTITGVDLGLELTPFSPADALIGMPYRFKAVVTNHTALAVPEAVLTISLPPGLSNVTADHPGCSLDGLTLTCALVAVDPAAPVTIWVSGQVDLWIGEGMDFSASVVSTLPEWPELNSANNSAAFSTVTGLEATVFTEDFALLPFEEFTGGAQTTAPGGQTYLQAGIDQSLQLDLAGLPLHKNVIVSFELYVIGNWPGNNPGGLPAEWTFGPVGQAALLDTSFSNDPAVLQAYPRPLGQGSYPGRSGAEGLDELGYEATPDARYAMRYKYAHTAEDLHLLFRSLNLPDGALWGLDNIVIRVDNGYTQIYMPIIHTQQ